MNRTDPDYSCKVQFPPSSVWFRLNRQHKNQIVLIRVGSQLYHGLQYKELDFPILQDWFYILQHAVFPLWLRYWWARCTGMIVFISKLIHAENIKCLTCEDLFEMDHANIEPEQGCFVHSPHMQCLTNLWELHRNRMTQLDIQENQTHLDAGHQSRLKIASQKS